MSIDNIVKEHKISEPISAELIINEINNDSSSNDVTVNQVEDCSVSLRSINTILTDLLTHIKAKTPQEAAGIEAGTPLDDKAKTVITCEYVLRLAQEQKWNLARYMEDYYVFNGEFWVKLKEEEIKDFLGFVAQKISINRFKAQYFAFQDVLLKQFYRTGCLKVPESNKHQVKINLCNGTYVVDGNNHYLKQFDSNDFMRYKLPFRYDKYAEAPLFQRYLDRVLPVKEKQMVLAEHIGSAFIKNSVLKLEKAAFLVGSGANGKSVFFNIITSLLGSENVSNITLEELTDDKNYAKTFLDGKILNYASEISTKMNTTQFKTLVSNEPIMVRMIYEKPYILEDYAKLIFNANELPANIEHNIAFLRRCNIIEFNVTIPEAQRDPALANKIISQELPGVFNWVLAGMERLLKNQSFTKCKEIEDALYTYQKESDHVALFLEDYNYIKSSTEKIPLKILYDHFKIYAKDCGYPLVQDKSFSKRLKANGYYTERKGSGRYVYATKRK